MSGHAASRTPNTSSSRNSVSSSTSAKKKRLRRAPSRVRGARTDFCAEGMKVILLILGSLGRFLRRCARKRLAEAEESPSARARTTDDAGRAHRYTRTRRAPPQPSGPQSQKGLTREGSLYSELSASRALHT